MYMRHKNCGAKNHDLLNHCQSTMHMERNSTPFLSVVLAVLCPFAYLCVCSLSVGSGGVVFVSEKGLQLSNIATHSGYLRSDRRDRAGGAFCHTDLLPSLTQFFLLTI